MRRVALLLLAVGVLLGFVSGAGARPSGPTAPVEVLVLLDGAPLAEATPGRTLYGPARRLSLRAPASRTHLRRLASARLTVEERLLQLVPSARIRWRYGVVANGFAAVVPAREVARIERLAGVREVLPAVSYSASLDRSPQQIGAPALWGPALAGAGQGIKIGIIDDGVDQAHPFFDPAGYSMPAGFPKGQTAFTTPKVIVARAFPPARPAWKNAARPFDPDHSGHATHVAGIAAGNPRTQVGDRRISGVAPRAYIGNYKALTIPTDADVGLDGNSPELVAAIEAAVRDGMDVINLSLGEPEIEPARDVVARALDAAAQAGVVPVVAAGNEYDELGRGSVGSPGSSALAITVGAVTTTSSGPANVIANFSAAGPSPLSLRLKPDVSAPGVAILSSVPGGYEQLSGTSMATPHVAGAAALLRQRHPGWTPAQVKSALVQTAGPAFAGPARAVEALTSREGGGVADLVRADAPLLFAEPSGITFGLLLRGTSAARTIALADAGGGGGPWQVAVETQTAVAGARVTAPTTVTVPGAIQLTADATAARAQGELTGFVVLTRGADRRRVPFWLRVTSPALAAAKPTVLRRPGVYRGDTRGRPARVSVYRYPDSPAGIPATLAGPEQVFRVKLGAGVANFGVAITSRAAGASIQPRVVVAGDENRLTGVPALPFNLNPYLRVFGRPVLAAGAIRPAAGSYDVVFDSPTRRGAGRYQFRLWVNDVAPPTARLLARTVTDGRPLTVRVADAASGVDPATLRVWIDGRELPGARVAGGAVRVATDGLAAGRHTLRLQVSDFQESRNMENVARILPNTRILATTFVIR